MVERQPLSSVSGRGPGWVLSPGPRTYRHKEHGEEVDHGLHVELPLGSNADRGEEDQAAERGQEQFGHQSPHGLGGRGRCRPPGSPGQKSGREKARSLHQGLRWQLWFKCPEERQGCAHTCPAAHGEGSTADVPCDQHLSLIFFFFFGIGQSC